MAAQEKLALHDHGRSDEQLIGQRVGGNNFELLAHLTYGTKICTPDKKENGQTLFNLGQSGL